MLNITVEVYEMKVKKLTLIIVMTILIFTGCSKEIEFDSDNTYAVLNEIKQNKIIDGKPQYDDVYVFEDLESYKKYKQDNFEIYSKIMVSEEIDFSKENLLVHNTFLNKDTKEKCYGVTKITKRGNTVKLHIKADGYVTVSDEKKDKYYNESLLIIVSKDLVSKDNKIVVIKKDNNEIGVTINLVVE